MDSREDTAEAVGCPIRKSPDQRALASPRSLSQRATSFIASRRQGIHQMPFVHYNTSPRPSRKVTPRSLAASREPRPWAAQQPIKTGPDPACEAGSIPMLLNMPTRSSPRTRNPKDPDQRQRSTGACPRSLARHSPCHTTIPTPATAKASGSQHPPFPAGLWPAWRVPWWARADSNGRPHPYQGCALTS